MKLPAGKAPAKKGRGPSPRNSSACSPIPEGLPRGKLPEGVVSCGFRNPGGHGHTAAYKYPACCVFPSPRQPLPQALYLVGGAGGGEQGPLGGSLSAVSVTQGTAGGQTLSQSEPLALVGGELGAGVLSVRR